MVCEKCGEINKGTKFCTKCGLKNIELAPGKGLLKVTGILFIISGVIGSSIYSVSGNIFLELGMSSNFIVASMVLYFLYFAGSIFHIIAGISGIMYCKNIEKAKLLKYFAIIVIVYVIVSSIISMFSIILITKTVSMSQIISLIIGLFFIILPIYFLIGAQKNLNTKGEN